VKIFVAYPYALPRERYRTALPDRFAGEDVAFFYADERLENDNVLAKICRMMSEADTCMFDISGNNPNVMLELGIALGEKHPGFVAVDRASVTNIGADVVGWDQLRYDSFDDLAEKLHTFIRNKAVPTRDKTPLIDPYEEELMLDAKEFFNPLFMRNGLIGHFDLTVRPLSYNPQLIARDATRDKIREFQAGYGRRGVTTAVPWDVSDSKVENFSGGASLLYQHPEWSRFENARFRTSGLYRIVRVFSEDYSSTGTIQMDDRTIGIVHFIEQVTLYHLLARNIAGQILTDGKGEAHVTFVIDGLLNRRPVIDDPEVKPTYLIGAQSGSDRQFAWDGLFTLDALEDDAVNLARERIGEVFWSFGVRSSIVEEVQRRFLGKSEPRALPPKDGNG
jgi:hypothetical protein